MSEGNHEPDGNVMPWLAEQYRRFLDEVSDLLDVEAGLHAILRDPPESS